MISLGEQASMDWMHRAKSSLVPSVAKTTVTFLAVKVGRKDGQIGRRVQAAMRLTIRRV